MAVATISTKAKHIVGRYLTKNLLGPNKQILALRGDVITYNTLRTAEIFGLEEELLNSNQKDPIS